MASGIRLLSEDRAVSRIVDTIENAQSGEARFALVLGAGFSQGLVPTTRELITEDLPLWMKALKDKTKSFDELKKLRNAEKNSIAKDFWKDFGEKNQDGKYTLDIDEKTGLPTTFSEAYKAAFSPDFDGALGDIGEARSFQRALMKLDRNRLNAAHFLLGSILGVQPGANRTAENFAAAAAFSRLIVTTNFDPFLQIALQAVNQLYFMSDTPKLGVGREIFDASTDAIHLVYLHGSVHRRDQAASPNEIADIKKENAKLLARVFERMGVIVIGYHGWDDAIVTALTECDDFAYGLYWCGRADDPLAPGVVGDKVPEILKKRTASYVQVGSAGTFVARFFNKLVKGLPRLIENPIGQVRELLEGIDLSEIGSFAVDSKPLEPNILSLAGNNPNEAFIGAKESTIEALTEVEEAFSIGRNHRQSLALVKLKNSLGDYEGALSVIDRISDLDNGSECCSEIRVEQAYSLIELDKFEQTIKVCSFVIDVPRDCSVESLLKALLCRGFAFGMLGSDAKEIADYTSVIAMEDVPAGVRAIALLNRGVVHGKQGRSSDEIEDYSTLIEMEGTSAERRAAALLNRGVAFEKQSRSVEAIADYTRVIETNDVSVDVQVQALLNRGVSHRSQGKGEKAIADWTSVIEMKKASAAQRGTAIGSIGWLFYEKRELEKFLEYTENALSLSELDFVRFNLGLALLANFKDDEAKAAYRLAGERFPNRIEELGILDLQKAVEDWLSGERAAPIIELLEKLKL